MTDGLHFLTLYLFGSTPVCSWSERNDGQRTSLNSLEDCDDTLCAEAGVEVGLPRTPGVLCFHLLAPTCPG